jgi:hypothetical protein
MGILKKTMSVLVLVFFVASLTAASASAGYWKEKCDCHKDKCDWGCHKDKCGCHKDRCGCHKDRCYDCDDFDFASFFGGSFFGDNVFFGEDGDWIDGW